MRIRPTPNFEPPQNSSMLLQGSAIQATLRQTQLIWFILYIYCQIYDDWPYNYDTLQLTLTINVNNLSYQVNYTNYR
jgi:hypothetical protein